MNEAWECPRCGRINAPFNPSCFCKPEECHDNSIEKSPAELSPHVMDAARYLDPGQLYKIMEGEKRKAEIAIGLMPKFYNETVTKTKVNLPQNLCLICGIEHNHGQHCATLQNNLPPNGEFI